MFVAWICLYAYYAVVIGMFVAYYAVACLGLGKSRLDYPRTLSRLVIQGQRAQFIRPATSVALKRRCKVVISCMRNVIWQAAGEQVVTVIIKHLSAYSRWTSTSSANNLNCSVENTWRRIKYAITKFLYVNEDQRHKCVLRPLSVASELPCVWLIVWSLSATK